MSKSLSRLAFAVLGCVGLLLAGATPARADHIDKELFSKANAIMKDLETNGYKNVAILKFQVKQGSMAPSLTAGKLNYGMATRLENALILKDNADSPIGITRGASAVAAAKDKKATYLTLEGRQKLFKTQYPLAWGTQNVQVDAFLTGMVEISADMKKTTVIVQAFDKKRPNLREVTKFTVETDVAILRDTNRNFVVARRTFQGIGSDGDPDEELNKIAVEEAKKENQPGVSRRLSVDEMKEYLEFQILFDGQPADVTPDGFLNKPTAGQKVLIKLTAKARIGLLLRINGVNTLNEQRDEKGDLNEYSWWVLDAGTEYTIEGFHSNGIVKTFIAKAAADVDIGAELGEKADRHGKIEFDVFAENKAASAVPKTRKFSFRTVNTRAADFATMRKTVQKGMNASNKKVITRAFIVAGEVKERTLETTTFDGFHVGGLTINYRRDLTEGTGDQ